MCLPKYPRSEYNPDTIGLSSTYLSTDVARQYKLAMQVSLEQFESNCLYLSLFPFFSNSRLQLAIASLASYLLQLLVVLGTRYLYIKLLNIMITVFHEERERELLQLSSKQASCLVARELLYSQLFYGKLERKRTYICMKKKKKKEEEETWYQYTYLVLLLLLLVLDEILLFYIQGSSWYSSIYSRGRESLYYYYVRSQLHSCIYYVVSKQASKLGIERKKGMGAIWYFIYRILACYYLATSYVAESKLEPFKSEHFSTLYTQQLLLTSASTM